MHYRFLLQWCFVLAGFCPVQAHLHEGTAHGYLRPAMEQDNLHVAVQSEVMQVTYNTIPQDTMGGIYVNPPEWLISLTI